MMGTTAAPGIVQFACRIGLLTHRLSVTMTVSGASHSDRAAFYRQLGRATVTPMPSGPAYGDE